MTKKRTYSRTAALIGSQSRSNGRRDRRRRKPVRIRWGIILPALGIVAFLAVIFLVPSFWYLENDTFRIHGVPKSMYFNIMDRSGIYGWHSLVINADDAIGVWWTLYPDMKDIQADCKVLPAQCDVYFTQRTPAVIWVSPDRTMVVDATPYVFRTTPEVGDLPVITGPLPQGDRAESELRGAIQGVVALQELGVPVHNLAYHPQRGLVWVDEAGRSVAFGTGPYMQARWDTYQKMLAYFASNDVFPRAIDVRFPAGVTYILDGSW